MKRLIVGALVLATSTAYALPEKKEYIYSGANLSGDTRSYVHAREDLITEKQFVEFSVGKDYNVSDNGAKSVWSINMRCDVPTKAVSGILIEDYDTGAWYSDYSSTTHYTAATPDRGLTYEYRENEPFDYYFVFDDGSEYKYTAKELQSSKEVYAEIIGNMKKHNSLKVRIYDREKEKYEHFTEQFNIGLGGFTKIFNTFESACKNPYK